ncbi:MAG: hypothetical protein ABIV47_01340 [Roseiflexaceae bacterium]
MTHRYDEHSDAEQVRARQVAEVSPAQSQQPGAFEDAVRTDTQIDQLVERVRWLMRREPMLEREMRFEN